MWATVVHQAPVGLQCPGQDDQVLQLKGQAHRLGLIDPAPHLCDGERDGAAVLGRLLREVRLPVRFDQQRRLAHLAQPQGVDHRSQLLAQCRIVHIRPPVRRVHRGLDRRPDVANQPSTDADVERRVCRVAVGEQLVQQAFEGRLKVHAHWRPGGQCRVQRLELLFGRQLMHDGLAGFRANPVGHFQVADHLDAQRVSLVPGHGLGLHPVDKGQVLRVGLEAVTLQDVVQHHVALEVSLGLGAEEGRQPDQRLRQATFVFGQSRQVIGRRAVRLVERQVHHDGPGAGAVLQAVVGHFPHVLIHHLHLAAGAAPVEVVVMEHRAAVGDTQLLEQQLTHRLAAVAGVVHHLGRLQHRLQVHARDLDGHQRVGVLGDLQLAHLTRPVAQLAQHLLRLLARNGRAEGAVVKRRQARGGQRLQRFHLGHQRGQQQGLEQACVVAQDLGAGGVGLTPLDGFPGGAGLGLQHRQQALVVQALGVVEVHAHGFRERLVAIGNGVPQIAHRDQLPQLQIGTPVHQQLHHQLQRRAFALQGGRHRNQRLHQGRRERIDLAEHVPVGLGRQQRVQHIAPQPQHVIEGGGQGLACVVAHRAQHALFGNGRQVAVFQRDAVEAGFPVLEHIAELHTDCAAQVLAHQVAQVALPGHEADQRYRPFGMRGLDQLDQLGALAADKRHIARPTGQPQHQLVQKQDDGVIAQAARMPAHDGQARIQAHERLLRAGNVLIGGEELADQRTHQPRAVGNGRSILRLRVGKVHHRGGRFGERGLETEGVPAALHQAPAITDTWGAAGGLVQLLEEGGIAHALTKRRRVGKQLVCGVEARHGRAGVQPPHMLGIAAQNGRFHVGGADHVVRHHQEALALGPTGLLHRRCQLGQGPGLRMARQQQVQHRHEVALA